MPWFGPGVVSRHLVLLLLEGSCLCLVPGMGREVSPGVDVMELEDVLACAWCSGVAFLRGWVGGLSCDGARESISFECWCTSGSGTSAGVQGASQFDLWVAYARAQTLPVALDAVRGQASTTPRSLTSGLTSKLSAETGG